MGYCHVESIRMYPPLPFQRIPTSLERSLTHKWIRQMVPGRPRHIGAPVRNLVRYSMVSLCGLPSRPDRYRRFVVWFSEFLRALFNILPLAFCSRPYPGTRGLHLSRLNTLRLLGPNLFYQMWNTSKRDPKTSMLLEVQVLQKVLIWGKLCHRMSHETFSFSVCQTISTR